MANDNPIFEPTSINSGSGAIKNASEKNARENLNLFLAESGVDQVRISVTRMAHLDRGDGRYSYSIRVENCWKPIQIRMPGCAFADVHYEAHYRQNPWEYPRLYLDGASWLWVYALHLFTEIIDVTTPHS